MPDYRSSAVVLDHRCCEYVDEMFDLVLVAVSGVEDKSDNSNLCKILGHPR